MNGENKPETWDTAFREKGMRRMALTRWLDDQTNYWKYEKYSQEEIDRIITAQVAEHDAIIMEKIMKFLSALLDRSVETHNQKAQVRHILEVGVGVGSLTYRLVPEALKHEYIYHAVDFSSEAREITCNELRRRRVPLDCINNIVSGRAEELPYEDSSMWLVIWGRFGQHLTEGLHTDNSQWNKALEETKRVLQPQGYFMLYESLLEFNFQRKPGSKVGTWLRSQSEYTNALSPLQLVKSMTAPFMVETYSIMLFQKP